MHVLYVHQNFPGPVRAHRAAPGAEAGWRCTFVSETPAGHGRGIEKIQYKIAGGATRQNTFLLAHV